MSELVLVGVSHRSCAIDLRERLSFSPEHAARALRDLTARPSIQEVFVLSTCGRTEFYGLAADSGAAEVALLEAMASRASLEPEPLAAQTTVARGTKAVHHLFRVAAGLDSMVLGEREILGQLRRARDSARAAGAISHAGSGLVDRALRAGTVVRERTGIGDGRVSIATIAVGLAQDSLPVGGRALIIGSGEMGTKTAKALQNAGLDISIMAGRRRERARSLAADVGGRTVAFETGLIDPLVETDLVVSCTAATQQVVPFELLVEVMERRTRRPLLVFDLALPRDFDPRARGLEGLRLHDVDDLEATASSTANLRAAAVPDAEAMVCEEAERCARWLAGLRVVPTIKGLHQSSQEAVLEALRRTDLGAEADESMLRRASQAIVARLLHQPTLTLREAAGRNESDRLVQSVRELFALEDAD